MISAILIMLAAICNASMDVCSFHYYYSIFTKFDDKFFNSNRSWYNKYIDGEPSKGRRKWFFGLLTLHPAFTDSFHMFKSLMVVFLISAIPFCPKNELGLEDWIYYLLVIGIGGTIWNLTFNLFYNHILRKK